MSSVEQKLLEVTGELSLEKQAQLLDFAYFLRFQQKAGGAGDQRWEQIIQDPRGHPKLDRFIADSLAEGPAEPLDLGKL